MFYALVSLKTEGVRDERHAMVERRRGRGTIFPLVLHQLGVRALLDG